MKIRHRDYGDVEGVESAPCGNDNCGHWKMKERGRTILFHEADGWSEVKEPRYVDVTGKVGVIEVSEFNTQLCIGPHNLMLPKGYRALINEWYALPDTNTEFIFNSIAQIGHSEEIFRYLQKFRKPCITLEKETT